MCRPAAVNEVNGRRLDDLRPVYFFPFRVSHHFTSTDDLVAEVADARVFGGMHFRTSVVRGGVLGRKAAQWVDKHYFQPTK